MINKIDERNLESLLVEAKSMSNVFNVNGKFISRDFLFKELLDSLNKKDKKDVLDAGHPKKQMIKAVELTLDKKKMAYLNA